MGVQSTEHKCAITEDRRKLVFDSNNAMAQRPMEGVEEENGLATLGSFQSTKMITNEDCNVVEKHLSCSWYVLAQKLDFLGGEIDRIDRKPSPENRVSQLLQKWLQTHTRNATVGLLCDALCEIGEKSAAVALLEANKQ